MNAGRASSISVLKTLTETGQYVIAMPETASATVDYTTVSMPASVTLHLLDSLCSAMQRRIDATSDTLLDGPMPDAVTGQLIELRAWTKNVANLRESYRHSVDAAVARQAAAGQAS